MAIYDRSFYFEFMKFDFVWKYLLIFSHDDPCLLLLLGRVHFKEREREIRVCLCVCQIDREIKFVCE